MHKKKSIPLILSLSLAIATIHMPATKCINPGPIAKIAKAAGYSTVGTGTTVTGALSGMVSIFFISLLFEQQHGYYNFSPAFK